MKIKRGNVAILILALVFVGLGIALWVGKQYRAFAESYHHCVAYFHDAKAGPDAVKGRTPDNDLSKVLESYWGPGRLKELDEASDWVAYDERRNVVYFFTWRSQPPKLGLNQEGPLREHSGSVYSGASCGFTGQIIFTQVRFVDNTIEFFFHTSARELDRSVLEGYGLKPGIQYVLRVDDSDQTFELGAVDHDNFLRQAVSKSAPPGKE